MFDTETRFETNKIDDSFNEKVRFLRILERQVL